MPNKLLCGLTGLALACLMTGPALASNNKAMDADIHSVELQWEHIKFDEDGSPNQFAHIDALANFTASLVQKYPGRVEPLIWEGIITSEEAGMANTLSAMGYAKKAKAVLEAAYQKDPAALDAGAPTSLGVLYYRVPGFPFGFGGVMTGAATVFFAVFGYDAMSTAAEESKDARKHMPKAILLSLAIAMVRYVLATLVLTGMQNYTKIDPKSGFASAFASVGLGGAANIIAVGAIIGIITVLLTFMLGVTRVWFSMSRDGLLPEWFAKTSPRRRVPTRVTWIVGIASAVLAGVVPISTVAELTNIGILLAFVVVCASVIVLRYRRPDIPRRFRLPLMPVVPVVGVIASLWLISYLHWETWVRFAAWFVLGLIVYFAYSKRHSLLSPDSPRHRTGADDGTGQAGTSGPAIR